PGVVQRSMWLARLPRAALIPFVQVCLGLRQAGATAAADSTERKQRPTFGLCTAHGTARSTRSTKVRSKALRILIRTPDCIWLFLNHAACLPDHWNLPYHNGRGRG